jgi:hypothetical protein
MENFKKQKLKSFKKALKIYEEGFNRSSLIITTINFLKSEISALKTLKKLKNEI